MSGDVQPRKRKDKKRKKDDLGVEEPRGTAAVLGEGDVFMHSQHEHGTGGHWCAKIIFFSLLGVLITLIGLIILENRGLTELEANSVESRYSGVLEGWLEDAPDDAHHDEHTLELLKQHDEQDIQIESQEDDHDDENYEINENDSANEDIEESEEEDVDEDEQETSNEDVLQQSNEDDDDDYDNDDENKNGDDEKSEERILEDTEEADDEDIETGDNNEEDNERGDDDENTERDDDDEDKARGDDDDNNSNVNDEIYEDDDQNNDDQNVERQKLNEEDSSEHFENDQSDENMNNEFGNNENNNVGSNHELDSEENSHGEDFEEHEYHDEEENKDVAIELEKLEKEVLDEDQPSQEIEDEKSEEITKQLSNEDDSDDVDSIEDEEFLEVDDVDEPLPIVERIVVPKGKPLAEVEDEPTTIKPTDTLAEEEEYERQQEELRKEQAQASHEDGGNSIEDDWPGEPDEKYWRQQINEAEQALDQGEWSAAIERVSAEKLKGSARARWVLARAIDASAEAKRDNRLLTRAITAYLDVLKMNERLSDNRLTEIAERTLARIRFRGNYLSAEPVYRLLIRRFPDVVDHRNNLTVSLLMANRADLAEEIIKETLQKWPNDRIALAHLGFILKTQHNRLEEAVDAFHKALEGDIGSATEPRFYYHLGDAYLLLGRFAEAHEVHKRGAKLGHFLSPAQRSLYNVNRLKSRPWWNIEQTPYMKLARALEKSWKDILKEGQAAQALYEKEKEGLKERGEWSQLDLFIRGQEVPGRCKKAPVTCSVVRSEAAAVGCRRGQIKFSSMEAGTHVRPHVGPTNCRLRMHLGLSNTKDTYIRVDQETRQWQVGKVFMFDDSFEHEVWHNGTGTRLVLIVDVWHPDLSVAERRSLAPI